MVDFHWDAVEGATYYEFLIDGASGTYGSSPTSNSHSLYNAELGYGESYTWSVKACNALGCSAATSETFTVAPAAPLGLAPQHGEQNVSLRAAVRWAAAEGADEYFVRVSVNNPPVNGFTDTTSGLSASLLGFLTPGTTYYWDVTSIRGPDEAGWATPRHFKTRSVTIDVNPVAVDFGPVPIGTQTTVGVYVVNVGGTTISGSLVVPTGAFQSLVGQYNSLAPGDSVLIEMRFSPTALTSYADDLTVTVNGQSGNLKVPLSGNGSIQAPELASPEDDAADQLRRPTYAWRPVASADNYEIEVTDALGAYVSQEMGLVDTTWTPADTLRSLHTYDWRVRGRYGSEEGPWSSAWSFTTGSLVYDAPTLLAPEDSSLNQPVSLELAWQPIEDANGYRVQIGLDSLFADVQVDSLIADGGSSSDSVLAFVGGLSIDTPYHWRVRVEDSDGTSAWSEVWQFRTIPGEPKRYYYVKDHLGSVRATVNEEGEVVHYDDFYPFGMQMPGRSHIAGTPTKENFTGHELDDETGLLYAGARYLDPVTARWLAIDRYADMYPGQSPYAYAANNPLLYIDVNGDSLYVEHTYKTGFLGLFGATATETAVYRNGKWYNPGTGVAFNTSSRTMKKLMNQVAGSMQAMSAAGGDAATAADAIESSTSFTTTVKRSDRNHAVADHQTQTALIELSGSTDVTSGFLRRGTGKMASNALTAAVHELGHAYDGLAGISRAINRSSGNVPFYVDERGSFQGYAEVVSMHIENVVRRSQGLALRAHYARINDRYVGPALLPVDNCSSFMPNNPCY